MTPKYIYIYVYTEPLTFINSFAPNTPDTLLGDEMGVYIYNIMCIYIYMCVCVCVPPCGNSFPTTSLTLDGAGPPSDLPTAPP